MRQTGQEEERRCVVLGKGPPVKTVLPAGEGEGENGMLCSHDTFDSRHSTFGGTLLVLLTHEIIHNHKIT